MPNSAPPLRLSLFHPGQQVAVAVSGGADSVALLRRLLEERSVLGLVLSVAHVHHGIRREEADADADFVASLAASFGLPFRLHRVDVPAAAALHRESLEEAARNLRYEFFRRLIDEGEATQVVTAHTLDDQAETVLAKLLRGAWTEGLSGIHAVLPAGNGSILRPFLEATRTEIEDWLRGIQQPWREDSSNQDPAHTRNRIRRDLLPLLKTFNPEIARQLSRVAVISGDEERYWQNELSRLLPSLLLPGRPTRGGGRSVATHPEAATIAIEWSRLKQLPPAVARRVLRAVAAQLGARLSFEHTERLLSIAGGLSGARRIELPAGVVAESSLRELRLTRSPAGTARSLPEYSFSIPGEVSAPEYDLLLHGRLAPTSSDAVRPATLRPWKAADRITLRHSRGAKRIKEVLDRLHAQGAEREQWPVVEVEGHIVWMWGVDVDAPDYVFTAASQAADKNP